MFKKMLIVTSCALVVAVATGTPDAQAAVQADASTGINWDSFSYTLSPGMSLNWSNQQTGLWGSADNWQNSASDSSGNWSDAKAVTASNPNGSATASAGSNGLNGQSSSSGNNSTSSQAYRYGYFNVTGGSGYVTFTIADYSQAVDLLAKGSGEYAWGSSQIWLDLSNQSYPDSVQTSSYIYGEAGDWGATDTFSAAKNSTGRPVPPLTLAMYFKAGEQGSFQANAYTYTSTSTPTPVPAAAWLLGSGLVGLAGLRRRKEIANA